MSKINRHPVRRTAAGVLAGALALSGAVATALPANAAPGFGLERIAGNDRFQTSAETVKAFGTAPGALLAAGENGRQADALAASFLAGVRGVPVALTTKTRVTAEVLAALNGLGGKNVTIIGGEDAVAASVVTQLQAAGFTVDRIGGANRYETAARVVAAGEGTSASNVGLLASGADRNLIDALAGGAVAYKGKHPLFLTTQNDIPGAIVASMRANGVTSVYILGGEAAVGPAVVAELAANGITVAGRLSGDDRSATSVAIARAVIGGTFGFSATTFNVASGINNGVDALGGAALSGKQGRVLLITNTATSAAPITQFAAANVAQLTTVGNVFGGTAAVATSLETAVETAAGAPPAGQNQTFTITPNDATSLVFVAPNPDTDLTDDRVYTVNGAVVGAVHQIRLVPAANVTIAANGNVTFLENGTTNLADLGSVNADITAVNGVPNTAGGSSATITPTSNSFTFRVDGESDETVVPVVFFDANTNGAIDLDANNAPLAAEAFGVGGATNYNPGEATVGGFAADATIGEVDKTANLIVTSAGTVEYDENDVFYVYNGATADATPAASQRRTLAQFEAELSVGDSLDQLTEYFRENSFSSTFVLEDVTPLVTGTPTVAARTSNSVTLTVPGVAAGATVKVYGEADPFTDTAPADAADDVDATVTTTDTVLATSSSDASATTGGFQIVVSGLQPATNYDLAVTQTVAGEESALSAEVETSTTAVGETVAPTITNAVLTTDAPASGILSTGDVFTLEFSERLDTGVDATGSYIRISDGDSVYQIEAGLGGNSFALGNGADATVTDDTLTITVGAAADNIVFVSGTNNGLLYPATITTVGPAFDDVSGNQLNLSGSADVVIDVE